VTPLTVDPIVTIRTFRAHPAALHGMRTFVYTVAAAGRFPPQLVHDMAWAVNEAAENTLAHTNSALIELTATVTEARIEIQVRDTGIFKRQVAMPEIDGYHGRGFPLMMAMTDEFGLKQGTPRRPGTVVRLARNLEP
jgi:anti-sigma regulatory factor (Ser/Thr protein kinase)